MLPGERNPHITFICYQHHNIVKEQVPGELWLEFTNVSYRPLMKNMLII